MKKTLAFLMALIMVLGMVPMALAEDKDITSWIIVENPEKLEGELEFWIPFKGNQGMDEMIAEFNSIYPNIKINLNVYSNNTDGNASVNSAMVAGEVDVLASFGLHHTYKRWENAMFVDLTDKVQELGIDLIANWGSDAYTYDGSIYTFPCGGLGHYVAINMTDWNEAGLGELPTEWTWDVMIWPTVVSSGDRPAARQRVTMSRSVNRPQTLPFSVHTGNAPILQRVSVRAATSTVSSGWIRITESVITSRIFTAIPPF